MSANSRIVRFVQPPARPHAGGSGTPVTDAERIVIRMLARRAASRWLDQATAVPTPEPKHR
jgi:hypothetical protein